MQRLSQANINDLESAASEVRDLIAEANAAIAEGFAKAEELIGQVAEVKSKAQDLMQTAADAAESYYDEKSEKWQEGDRGSTYSEWQGELARIADEIGEDIELPDVPEVEEPGWLDELTDIEFSEPSY